MVLSIMVIKPPLVGIYCGSWLVLVIDNQVRFLGFQIWSENYI